jgi:hypothetical protein
VTGNITTAGSYRYYWFMNNATVGTGNSKAYWEYTISSSVMTTGNDVDLFVSVIDGRKPIDSDFDYSSTNVGADSIVLSANDTFYTDRGLTTTQGVVVIVGVKALNNNVTFQLMMSGPTKYMVSSFVELTSTVSKNMTFLASTLRGTNNTHYFKFSNWGYKDFKVQIAVASGGPLLVYYNYYSENQFTDNAYLAVPLTSVNSLWTATVTAGASQLLSVPKTDTKNFCYYCQYYVTVVANSTAAINYVISYS